MTKPEAVTQEDRDAAAAYFKATGGSIMGINAARGNMDESTIVQAFARHRIAAEQRGMERERERCAGIAKVAWLKGGLNSPIDADEAQNLCEIIAQAIRQGEQA